ncbi:MAG: hypothetical protein NTZ55_00040 [Candidatus Roizmanbacteria bacterium]|nr:hypothetical protein [Candidatus Roizmanbacteria bacterium]
MKKIVNGLNALIFLAMAKTSFAQVSSTSRVAVGWTIPSLADVVGFLIKFLFFFAGLAALLYLLLGAFSWVTSSGDKENVKKAQDKIQAAVVGLVIIVVVLVIIATMEQVVLKGTFCVGLTCNIAPPQLIQP